jgi:hypothetical protein
MLASRLASVLAAALLSALLPQAARVAIPSAAMIVVEIFIANS